MVLPLIFCFLSPGQEKATCRPLVPKVSGFSQAVITPAYASNMCKQNPANRVFNTPKRGSAIVGNIY
jgi:hypothetical protein